MKFELPLTPDEYDRDVFENCVLKNLLLYFRPIENLSDEYSTFLLNAVTQNSR